MSEKGLQYIIKFKESLRLLVILLKYFMIADAIDFQIDQKMTRNDDTKLLQVLFSKLTSEKK